MSQIKYFTELNDIILLKTIVRDVLGDNRRIKFTKKKFNSLILNGGLKNA